MSSNFLKKSRDDYGVKYQPLKSDDESEELKELKVISKNRFSPHSKPVKRDDVYVLKLNEEHSLHSIAFRYNCTLWELKRLNNLFSSQDFFSLKEIKIPCPKNSYRSVLLKEDGANKFTFNDIQEKENAAFMKQTNAKEDGDSNQNVNNNQFFQNMDNNIEKAKSSVGVILNRPNFDAQNFVLNQSYNLKRTSVKSPMCRWWHYIILFICCACVGPILYAFFLLWSRNHG